MTDFLEIKASLTVDDAGEISGIAWPFGSPDRVGDVIEKGAITAPALTIVISPTTTPSNKTARLLMLHCLSTIAPRSSARSPMYEL